MKKYEAYVTCLGAGKRMFVRKTDGDYQLFCRVDNFTREVPIDYHEAIRLLMRTNSIFSNLNYYRNFRLSLRMIDNAIDDCEYHEEEANEQSIP